MWGERESFTDWNQIVEGLECWAKEFGLKSAGNEPLQNFSLCVSRATGLPHGSSALPQYYGKSIVAGIRTLAFKTS